VPTIKSPLLPSPRKPFCPATYISSRAHYKENTSTFGIQTRNEKRRDRLRYLYVSLRSTFSLAAGWWFRSMHTNLQISRRHSVTHSATRIPLSHRWILSASFVLPAEREVSMTRSAHALLSTTVQSNNGANAAAQNFFCSVNTCLAVAQTKPLWAKPKSVLWSAISLVWRRFQYHRLYSVEWEDDSE
jgi:hypothetical protein